ncbi:MAG: hypothetical protein KA354_20815 [Phycisphaerae bacterium]|nr:hypothetical protein [Phycisphaerae bacterium]
MRGKAAAIIVLLAGPVVSTGAVIHLQLPGGGAHGRVSPGRSFVVEVVLDLEGAEKVAGFEAQLRDSTGSGKLTWTKRTWGGSLSAGTGPIADPAKMPFKTGGFPAMIPAPGTDPESSAGFAVSIGLLASDGYPQADIQPWIEQLTLKLSLAAGREPYVISLEDGQILFEEDGNAVPLRMGTTVTIPEPSSLLLLVFGSLLVYRGRG